MKKTTKGAWIVHHGQRTKSDTRGGADFSAIDTASKAGTLLTQIARSSETEFSNEKIRAYAVALDLNPNLELRSILNILQESRLISIGQKSVVAIAASTTTALESTSDIFLAQNPSTEELASIEVSEMLSTSPQPENLLSEFISDNYKIDSGSTIDLLRRAESIGFIDAESADGTKLYFNGNIFRGTDISKVRKVLNTLNQAEQRQLGDLEAVLKTSGQTTIENAERIATKPLIAKLRSVALIDVSYLENEIGSFGYVTLPAAFHKFADPFVDDAFDLAKALVAALAYGMQQRKSEQGKIWGISLLLGKLIRGGTVGPAPAIGNDYKLLEQRGVVEVFPDGRSFSMRLLKADVGELALKVLVSGDSEEAQVLERVPPVSMSGFITPSDSRQRFRKNRSEGLKRTSFDVLQTLRTKKI